MFMLFHISQDVFNQYLLNQALSWGLGYTVMSKISLCLPEASCPSPWMTIKSSLLKAHEHFKIYRHWIKMYLFTPSDSGRTQGMCPRSLFMLRINSQFPGSQNGNLSLRSFVGVPSPCRLNFVSLSFPHVGVQAYISAFCKSLTGIFWHHFSCQWVEWV